MPRREPPRCHIVAVLTASMSHRCGSVARAAGAAVKGGGGGVGVWHGCGERRLKTASLNASVGVSRVTGILSAAECNKAPFMYEMKGALSGHSPGSAGFPASRLRVSQSPGLTVPDRLVSQPHRPRSTGHPASLFRFVRSPGLPGATRRPPVPGTRCKFRFPGLYIAPGEAPWMVPVSCGENISTPSAGVAQEPVPIHFKFFSCPHLVHRIPPVVRTSQRLSTALCTTTPQVTRRNSGNTSDDRPS